MRPRLLRLPNDPTPRLTHYLFRYPAKFHPPVVASLLDRFTAPGQIVFDPFVGSGTALVEAVIRGRQAVGLDIDPVAVEVSKAKTRRYNDRDVSRAFKQLLVAATALERPASEYEHRMFNDISEDEFQKTVADEGLWVPAIPRLQHWFRRYVIIDLARILAAIHPVNASQRTRLLMRLVFASIIRNSSNADPVPVSGLEYTAHMRRRDAAGRPVNPFALLRVAIAKTEHAVAEYTMALGSETPEPRVICGSSISMAKSITGQVDAILTSPPYHNAVDYYRRHQLEMFWLGLTNSQAEREKLLPGYIGRPHIPAKDPLFSLPWDPPPLARAWEERMRAVVPRRADDFRHYVQAMHRSFSSFARVVRFGGPMLMVVGHSSWNGDRIPTGRLFAELASDFALEDTLYYPVKNRYMSYARHNEASIDKEYVLVFVKK